ncbi:MAG TPA: DNA methyltransferase [Thermodesulfobacteriota bacterium]|nr:DNA methyltransferase [Thermodesulfobacteriota bacterium]
MASEHAKRESLRAFKRQLPLFASDSSESSASDFLIRLGQISSTREKLKALLESDLDFHGEDSIYASHNFHSFAAKFPPQLPRLFIHSLTNPGDTVLDPMMGSGTTLVEALLERRKGIGLDIDPLALRLGYAKTITVDRNKLREFGNKVLRKAYHYLSDREKVQRSLSHFFDEKTKRFIDYWFLPNTQRELMALVLAIQDVTDKIARQFLELTLSSIIVTKSGGVSRARDLAHSRPHLDETKIPKDALDQFSFRLKKNLSGIEESTADGIERLVIKADARSMPIADGVVNLIVTSPPYANAIDYMRAHKFSLVWFGGSVTELSRLRATYVGSERIGSMVNDVLPKFPQRVVNELQQLDQKKGMILRKYFAEMKAIFSEMFRVLREGSPAIVVVGTSTMRGIDTQTHHCLADIAARTGFDVVGVPRRTMDRNKRMMPARFGAKTSMIEDRMHEEYIIGLLKPALPLRH